MSPERLSIPSKLAVVPQRLGAIVDSRFGVALSDATTKLGRLDFPNAHVQLQPRFLHPSSAQLHQRHDNLRFGRQLAARDFAKSIGFLLHGT